MATGYVVVSVGSVHVDPLEQAAVGAVAAISEVMLPVVTNVPVFASVSGPVAVKVVAETVTCLLVSAVLGGCPGQRGRYVHRQGAGGHPQRPGQRAGRPDRDRVTARRRLGWSRGEQDSRAGPPGQQHDSPEQAPERPAGHSRQM
jgi:hypothetical protein